MKKFFLLVLTFAIATSAMAGSKRLSALFGYSSFYMVGSDKPYIETYLKFNANTLNFVKDATDQYRATVEITLVIRKNDSLVFVKKYDLNSPYTNSDTNTNFTFLDLQRIALPNGIYDFELNMLDKASNEKPSVYKDKILVFFQPEKPTLSNIQLMEKVSITQNENILSRNGYDMVPYFNDFIPIEITHLAPYIEIYNLNKELGTSSYSVYYHIEQKETGKRLADYDTFISRPAAKDYDPIITNIDIQNLPSGNYDLVCEVRNLKQEVLLRKKLSFQRSNPAVTNELSMDEIVASSFVAQYTDEKQLDRIIDALYPIASAEEISTGRELAKHSDLVAKQTFLYRFWAARDAFNPEAKWNEYKTRLIYVDENFSYPKTPGYRTDRGRVYLQYGPPDHIRDEKNFVGAKFFQARKSTESSNEPVGLTEDNIGHGHIHYLPYQLWRYNTLPGDYANRVFIFWDKFRSGYYQLLNSNARGELRTSDWERELSQRQLGEEMSGEVGEQFERGY